MHRLMHGICFGDICKTTTVMNRTMRGARNCINYNVRTKQYTVTKRHSFNKPCLHWYKACPRPAPGRKYKAAGKAYANAVPTRLANKNSLVVYCKAELGGGTGGCP